MDKHNIFFNIKSNNTNKKIFMCNFKMYINLLNKYNIING